MVFWVLFCFSRKSLLLSTGRHADRFILYGNPVSPPHSHCVDISVKSLPTGGTSGSYGDCLRKCQSEYMFTALLRYISSAVKPSHLKHTI